MLINTATVHRCGNVCVRGVVVSSIRLETPIAPLNACVDGFGDEAVLSGSIFCRDVCCRSCVREDL